MNWIDPRFAITLLLIGLFGYAYVQDPSDDAMKGALIAAFSAAYGFWIGSKENEKATQNTGKAFDAIKAQARTSEHNGDTLKSGDTVHLERQPADEEMPTYAV